MDSLLLKTLSIIQNSQDTAYHHIKDISHELHKINSGSWLDKLMPFIGVLLGGVITYITQRFLKSNDIKLAAAKEAAESRHRILTNLITLRFILKELAYLEVDSKCQYWYSQYDDTAEGKKKGLEENYNDYKYMADNRMKVALSVAEIHTGFIIYYKNRKEALPPETSAALQQFMINILSLPKADDYKKEDDLDSLKKVHTEQLTEKYTAFINPVKVLAENLS